MCLSSPKSEEKRSPLRLQHRTHAWNDKRKTEMDNIKTGPSKAAILHASLIDKVMGRRTEMYAVLAAGLAGANCV